MRKLCQGKIKLLAQGHLDSKVKHCPGETPSREAATPQECLPCRAQTYITNLPEPASDASPLENGVEIY